MILTFMIVEFPSNGLRQFVVGHLMLAGVRVVDSLPGTSRTASSESAPHQLTFPRLPFSFCDMHVATHVEWNQLASTKSYSEWEGLKREW